MPAWLASASWLALVLRNAVARGPNGFRHLWALPEHPSLPLSKSEWIRGTIFASALAKDLPTGQRQPTIIRSSSRKMAAMQISSPPHAKTFGAHEELPTSAQIELPTPKTGSATRHGAERGDIIPPQAAKSRVCRCRLGLMADPQQKPRGTCTKTTARSTMAGRPVGHFLASTDGCFSKVPSSLPLCASQSRL